MSLLKSILIGYIRHGLTAFAGYLFARGLVQQSDQQVLISAGVALAGVAWSTVNKLLQNRELALARKAPHSPASATSAI
jgi:hypothetical protein